MSGYVHAGELKIGNDELLITGGPVLHVWFVTKLGHYYTYTTNRHGTNRTRCRLRCSAALARLCRA